MAWRLDSHGPLLSGMIFLIARVLDYLTLLAVGKRMDTSCLFLLKRGCYRSKQRSVNR
jgi:hypothetical protein